MPSTEFSTWIDAPVGTVFAIATDPDSLDRWFRPVEAIRPCEGTGLGTEGSSLDADWRLGRTVRARLSTVRRVRDIVHLELATADGLAGRLCFAFGSWDGGTAVELRVDLDGWRLSRLRLHRALRRSGRDLAVLADRAAAETGDVAAVSGAVAPPAPVVRGARLSTGA